MSWLRLQVGPVDLVRGDVHHPDGVRRLTRRETELLGYLSARPGKLVGRDELLREVWGYRGGVRSRTVEATMHTLRAKVEREPARPAHLLTERGEGYRFVPVDRDDAAGPLVFDDVPELDPDARRDAALVRADALGYDDPAAGLAVLVDVPPDPELELRRAQLLAALGRVGEARRALAGAGAGVAPGGRARRALVSAAIAVRRGAVDEAEAALRRVTAGPCVPVGVDALDALPYAEGVAVATAEARLGVLLLDRGALDGFARLARAERWFVRAGATRLAAGAAGEIGMYRLLQGRPADALAAFDRSTLAARHARARYVERVTLTARAAARRLVGDAAGADADRATIARIAARRLEEPGVFAFLAIERALAGADPLPALRAGLARHAERPYAADHALVCALAAPRGLVPADEAARCLPRACGFVRVLVAAARGEPDVAERAAALEMSLPARLVGVFG